MNWDQFKDLVSHICLAGTVVAAWSLTQEVAWWRVRAFYCDDKSFCHWIQWKYLGKTQPTLSEDIHFITFTISMYTLLHVQARKFSSKGQNIQSGRWRLPRRRPKLTYISNLWRDQFKHTSIKIDLPSFWFCSELWPRTLRVLPACVRTRAAMRSASTPPSWRWSERSRGRRRWRCSRSSWTDRCSPPTRGLKIITRIKIHASFCK